MVEGLQFVLEVDAGNGTGFTRRITRGLFATVAGEPDERSRVIPPPPGHVPGPARAGGAAHESHPPAVPATPPGRGFDVWCLTDPDLRLQLGGYHRAVRAIERVWNLDPDPERTLELHAAILKAFDAGSVGYAADGRGRIGHFHRCPWGPVYVARRPLDLGGRRILKGQRFVLDVGAETMERGTRFRRQVVVGRLERAESLSYSGA